MSKIEKLLNKLRSANKTFSWSELVTLMTQLGYLKKEMEGSRVRFFHPSSGHVIKLHRPHPENHIRGGALRDVRNQLKQEGYL